MRKSGTSLTFSPTDLINFMENPYVTWMDRYELEHPGTLESDKIDEETVVVMKLGLEHERSYLQQLKNKGKDILEIPWDSSDAVDTTLSAMHEGREIIYQAALMHYNMSGYGDFLFRVDQPSELGKFSYEARDTKLSLKAKPLYIIQLCCYSDLLEEIQGLRPPEFSVIMGDATEKRFRTNDYFFYYLHLKKAFLKQQAEFDPESPPEPLPEGQNGRWNTVASQWLEENDHLSLVADIRKSQIQRLKVAGIETVADLANSKGTRVPRLRSETHDKLRNQARLQIESRELDQPKYEIILPDPDNPRRGFALLPPPSDSDVVFDIEGYPLVQGGLEYLLGVVHQDNSELLFTDWWAHDPIEEKKSFEDFIDWVHARWQHDPTMHIYHYAAYEITAMRRLMGKYGTREYEVDDLLRNHVFVDLYKVLRQGLRVGVPSYSLKKVELLYLGERTADVATAGESIVYYQRWLETKDGDTWETSEILKQIRDYNREDCISTWKLLEWLCEVQRENDIPFIPPVLKEEEEETEKKENPAVQLATALLDAIPQDRANDEGWWRDQELLAWLLEYHWREAKPVWWAMFDRHESTEEELYDDIDCLAGLNRTDRPSEPVKRSVQFEYRYDPDQETKLEVGDICFFAHDLEITVTIQEIDKDEGLVAIKCGPSALNKCSDRRPPDHLNLIPNQYVSAKTIADSIERSVRSFAESGELTQALEDFLHRKRPRIRGRSRGPIIRDGEDLLEATTDAVMNMDETTLCIQGPPGTGKTYTGGHVILELLKKGNRVGISANSHKAILNLMYRVATFAEERGYELNAAKIGGDEDETVLENTNIHYVPSVSKMGWNETLIGGTAWVFSSEYAVGQLDYLFIDEAGQVSVANLVGMVPSTRNIVLLGDQMQLAQPTQGSHPGESGSSILDYLLQDHATIPKDMGIFLERTWRLHPEVCRFISDSVYEGRLLPEPHTANRHLIHPEKPKPRIDRVAGIVFIPCQHEGNTQGSEEEVQIIKKLVGNLLSHRQTDEKGADIGRLTLNDILIVAPYNLQVRMLQKALGRDARVGTIDKFQGQEAPVVIVSMTASAGDTSPRGVDFLFSKNRINVAISRAKSLAIVVGHPDLTLTPCNTINQMELVNLYCRVVKEGTMEC